MATHDYVIANQGFPAFRADLNDALAAIVSNNSSATEPSTTFAHMVWIDTAANPSILKIRNADNDAWITIMELDQTNDNFGQTFPSGKLKLSGSTSGTATLNAPAEASTNTYSLPPAAATLGYRNIPAVGEKTTSYTLAVADIGKYVRVGSGGSITIPDATFSEGDAISIFNNTTGDVTITCSITTAYIAGDDTDVASVTLATRGVATVLFISGTVCVLTGNIS